MPCINKMKKVSHLKLVIGQKLMVFNMLPSSQSASLQLYIKSLGRSAILRFYCFFVLVAGVNSSTQVTMGVSFMDKIYVVGYFYLTFPVVVGQLSFARCHWRFMYDKNFGTFSWTYEVYIQRRCVQNRFLTSNETVLCSTNSTSILSTLSVTRPLEFGKIIVNFSCDGMMLFRASINVVCEFYPLCSSTLLRLVMSNVRKNTVK